MTLESARTEFWEGVAGKTMTMSDVFDAGYRAAIADACDVYCETDVGEELEALRALAGEEQR